MAGTQSRAGLLSRAVLIGVSRYDDARLPPIGTAGRDVEALREALSDPMVGLLAPGQITVILDPDSASGLAKHIADVAAETVGTLLLCYVGHGVLSADRRLYLTVRSTDLDSPGGTALAWDSVARVLHACPARVRRVILDCSMPATRPTDLPRLDGVETLTVASVQGIASASRDAVRTDLVGELVGLIRTGMPAKPAWLALADLYPALCDRLLARDLPVPEHHSGTDSTPWVPFVANAALDAGQRAAMVLTEATRVARSFDDPADQAQALADIAEAWAPLDPERAEHLVTGIRGDPWKSGNLARVARGLAGSAPQRAAHLLDHAHRLAGAIPDECDRELALAHVVWGLALIDVDQAERLAASITRESWRAMAYEGIVGALAATDLDRAEQVAYTITDDYYQGCALLHVAQRRVPLDRDRAERVLGDAERLARTETHLGLRAMALAGVARVLASQSPDRAGRVLDDAVDLAYSAADQGDRVLSLANVVNAMAGMDPSRAKDILGDAERMACSISDERARARSLMYVVRGLSPVAPARAEHLACSITDEGPKVSAMVYVAAGLGQRFVELEHNRR